jgi:hypothetical protein
MVKFENSTTGKPPQNIKTELQLFPKKCEVKLQKHSNHIAGRAETPKNGQDLRSQSEQEKIIFFVSGQGRGH